MAWSGLALREDWLATAFLRESCWTGLDWTAWWRLADGLVLPRAFDDGLIQLSLCPSAWWTSLLR